MVLKRWATICFPKEICNKCLKIKTKRKLFKDQCPLFLKRCFMILPFHIRSKFTFLRFIFLGPDTFCTNTILDGIKPCNFFQIFFQIKNEGYLQHLQPVEPHEARPGPDQDQAEIQHQSSGGEIDPYDLFCSEKIWEKERDSFAHCSKYVLKHAGIMYWRHLEISSMQFMMTAHIFLDSVLSSMDILRIGKECKKNKNCFLFWSGETWLAISCVMLHSFQSVTYWSNDAIW